MFKILSFLILIFSADAPSQKYDTAVAAATVLPSTETDKAGLLKRVKERGTIRVRITYDMDHLPVRFLGPAYQNQIFELHARLIRELNYHHLFFDVIRKENTRPQITLSINEDTLLYLFNSNMVKNIRHMIRSGHHPIIRH